MGYFFVVYSFFVVIFRRMGLNIVVADAQSGNISDKPSQEFHVLSPTMGEDDIVFCPGFFFLIFLIFFSPHLSPHSSPSSLKLVNAQPI